MYTQAVTRLRAAAGTDTYGNAHPDWTTPVSLVLEGVNVVPVVGSEVLEDGRAPVVSGWKVISEPGRDIPDVTSADRIIHGGVTYEVDGEPQIWPDPITGRPDHSEISIKRKAGLWHAPRST